MGAIVLREFLLSGDSGEPQVTVTFLGYTNSNQGKRVAEIKIQNTGRQAVRRVNFFCILQSPNFSVIPLSGEKALGTGRNEIVNVETPSRSGKWSACFIFKREPDIFQRILLNLRQKSGWLKRRWPVSQYDEEFRFDVVVSEIPDFKHPQTFQASRTATEIK
jgi:hypothetical protein